MINHEFNVGVVGATGIVGRTMLDVLAERDFPVDDLRVFASHRSAGIKLDWKDRELTVEDIADGEYEGLDIVLFSVGSAVSKRYAPEFVEAGAEVIDNSSAWRQDPDVPLVVSEVNPDELGNLPKGIIANPNCVTMVAMPVLKPLHDQAGLTGMAVTTFQAASGAGQRGIDELAYQLMRRNGRDDQAEANVFPRRLAGNVIPLRGGLVGSDTDEELKLRDESRKILGIAGLAVSTTCVSVPVLVGHSLSVEASFSDTISPEQATALLRQAPGVRLADIPTPLEAAGGDESLVGRIRQSGFLGEKGLQLFIVNDNLRKGAALNAVQIAELLTGVSRLR